MLSLTLIIILNLQPQDKFKIYPRYNHIRSLNILTEDSWKKAQVFAPQKHAFFISIRSRNSVTRLFTFEFYKFHKILTVKIMYSTNSVGQYHLHWKLQDYSLNYCQQSLRAKYDEILITLLNKYVVILERDSFREYYSIQIHISQCIKFEYYTA